MFTHPLTEDHPLQKIITDWRPPVFGSSPSYVKTLIPSTYQNFGHYSEVWTPLIYLDFKLILDEYYHRLRGHPVAFDSFSEKKDHSYGAVSFVAAGLHEKQQDCVLLLGSTCYCFYSFPDKRLIMAGSNEAAFLAGEPLFFTGISLRLPLTRLAALESFSTFSALWFDRILHAQCADLPISIIYDPLDRQGYAMKTAQAGPPGLYMWQGPPGTGKTWVTAFMVWNYLKMTDTDVFITSHSNDAVFNIVGALLKMISASLINWSVTFDRSAEYGTSQVLRSVINPRKVDGRRVWLSTCNHAHVVNKKFVLIINDEGAFCPEPDLLVVLTQHLNTDLSANAKVILVGDPMQLPPVLKMFKTSQMCGSLMGRCSIMSKKNCVMFNVSHRVGPWSAKFLGENFYNDDFESCVKMVKIHIFRDPTIAFPEIAFIDVGDGRESRVGSSKANDVETTTVTRLVQVLILNGVPGNEIVVMTPYAEQVNNLKQGLRKRKEEGARKIKPSSVHVSTVHGMQGSQRPFVIMNTVRTEAAGFIDDAHIMCVSVSRQNVYLVVVGNAAFLSTVPIWNKFILMLRHHGQVHKISWLETFRCTA